MPPWGRCPCRSSLAAEAAPEAGWAQSRARRAGPQGLLGEAPQVAQVAVGAVGQTGSENKPCPSLVASFPTQKRCLLGRRRLTGSDSTTCGLRWVAALLCLPPPHALRRR